MFLRKGKRIAMKDYSFEEPFEKYQFAEIFFLTIDYQLFISKETAF